VKPIKALVVTHTQTIVSSTEKNVQCWYLCF